MVKNVQGLAVVLIAFLAAASARAQPSTGTVTYQGVLTQGGQPVADGTYALTFRIYDAASGGVVVETVTVPGVQTVQGRFAALVPVSPSTFNGADRWWSVTFNGTELPRQKVTASPYSLHSGASRSLLLRDGPTTVTMESGRSSPEAAFLFYGDGSGWKLHFNQRIDAGGEDSHWFDDRGNQWSGGDVSVSSLTVRGAQRQFDVDVNGWVRCAALSITGADIAEKFHIAGESGAAGTPDAARPEPRPGMVVSISPHSPGKLMVSSAAYDRKVAGVISGANGLSVGAVLGQGNDDPLIDGEHPVAMTGRVWVYADESAPGSRIEPGDRLTTSGTRPGYAMKVLDETRAPGAVIGKAMTSVDPKTGMVLVLVNLQ